jgi:predicted dehydrogenase
MPEVDSPKYASENLRFAVVGFGKMGILHSSILNLLQPNSVQAIVDKSRLISLVSSKLLKNTAFYNDIGKTLEKDVPDAFYVTTPAQSHFSIVSQLLQSGVKYIFVEKPPTINSEQLVALIDMAGSGQLIMAGLQKRFALPFRHARLLLSKHVVGELKSVSAYVRSSDMMLPSSRFVSLGKGTTLDLGIHLLDLLVWIFNVNTVESATSRTIYTQVDDYFEAKLSNDSHLEFNIEVTWSNPEYRMPETCIEVVGTGGKLKVTEDYLTVFCETPQRLINDQKLLTLYRPHYYQNTPIVNLADPEYTLENIHFLNSISLSRQPLTDFRNLTQVMNLLGEMYSKAGNSAPMSL